MVLTRFFIYLFFFRLLKCWKIGSLSMKAQVYNQRWIFLHIDCFTLDVDSGEHEKRAAD